MADPLVESETDIQSVVESKLREKFQLRGIALSDVEIVSAMDEGEIPCVLPPLFLKSGELKKTAKALDEQQFTALLAHARQTASELAERLFEGETLISPTCESGRSACDYCDFRTVCHFDCQAPDAQVREIPAMSMEELRQALCPAKGQEECK